MTTASKTAIKAGTAAGNTSGSVEQTQAKTNVLIVDDTPSNLLALSAVLGPLGVRVVQAQSGAEALERVREMDFAVALLDVQMPEMDGFEVATRMRATENGRELPIIFLTALHRDESFVRRGYAVGAADYITKPYDAEVLRARVRAFVDLFGQREAVRRAQMAVRTRERDEAMRRAVVFERIATAALETTDLNEFLRELLQILLSVSEAADSATILLREGETLHVRASVVASHEQSDEAFSVRIGEGFAGRIAATRKPMEISEQGEHAKLLAAVQTARGAQALFGVPLLSEGQVLGVAHVGSTHASAFTEQDKRLLVAIAERAAWAVSKHQERARVHDIVNSVPALIAIFRGPERAIELANPTFARFFGASYRSSSRTHLAEIHPSIAHALENVHASGDPVFIPELSLQNGDEVNYINLSAQPLVGSTGVRDNVLVFAVDVTAEVRARRQIEAHQFERARLLERERAARQQAETANRSKDEFLATISHELRTPLNAVIGWTARARAKAPPELDRALAIIERNAQSQARIIEDMLDLSRIISGRLRLEVKPTSVREPVLGALEAVRPAAEAKGVTLEVDALELPPIHADPERLQQVIWNLLSNAIKFTPRGGHVSVQGRGDADKLTLRVCDTGQGMDAQFLPFVFEPFRQADGSTTRRHGGLGLGLSIVRQLVQAHGGVVRASSAGTGFGSTFEVELPRKVATASLPPSPLELDASAPFEPGEQPGTRLDGLKILVVDDEEDARSLLVEVLGERGARVTSAESVAHALAQFGLFKPDILVSDIGMPEADGYSLIRQVRRLAVGDGGETPAIALTAYARAEDVERAYEAGFQRHMAKPVDVERLITLISLLANGEKAEPLVARN
ncbi:MAG: Chemotaxis regulator [Myxococcaceae bacterium]|nr:Chemotaxis regulator [Myxococcaceae bacterium]